jgi:GT2 family glycosyltransferase
MQKIIVIILSYNQKDKTLECLSALLGNADMPFTVLVWDTAWHVKLDAETYALILNNVREKRTEVRLVSLQTPNVASEPVAVYQFDGVQQANLLLDEETETWFMYYRTHENSYGVKLAPAGDKPLPTSSTP